MTLFYLAIACLIGAALGRSLWEAGWVACGFPGWLWAPPLCLLPFTPLVNRLWPSPTPLRWPVSAGFETPRHYPSPGLILALLLCLFTGALRYISQPVTPCLTSSHLAYYNLPAEQAFNRAAPKYMLTGYVSSYPLVADVKQRMQVRVEQVTVGDTAYPVQGEVLLNTQIRQRYRYGQPVRLEGRLVEPPVFEDFPYKEYLARKGVHSMLHDAQIEVLPGPLRGNPLLRILYALRARGEAVLNHALPEPVAALANGILLGIESGIPDQLYDQFNITSVSHVIVISGSNVALISATLLRMNQLFFSRRRALWPTFAGIAAYALLVGGDAPVLRAAVMGGLYAIAKEHGRQDTALASLGLACWVMAKAVPGVIWDVGFQLSAAAVAGMVLFTPAITDFAQRMFSGFRGPLADILAVTVAANLTTMPLIVYYFDRLSLIGLLTNALIVPVQPYILLSGSLGVVLGVIGLPWLAQVPLWFTWLGLAWTVFIVRMTAEIPGASIAIPNYDLRRLSLTYLTILCVRRRRQIGAWFHTIMQTDMHQLRAALLRPTVIAAIGASAALAWLALFWLPDGRLHIYFLDVGQGDGILIETPSGRQVLIDGGASPERLFNELGEIMPFWDRSLDLAILTNPDRDHMEAQAQAPLRLNVALALETQASRSSPDAAGWRANMAAGNVDIQIQHAGHWIDLGDGIRLEVLWPPAEPFMPGNHEQAVDNENSLVLKLTYRNLSVLFTGDAGLPAEMAMLAAGAPVQANVLKVGHHGSRGSTSATFLQAVDPQLAVIQSGADNTYGHPHPEVLERLAGRTVLRNDLQGRVHLYSDGSQMWVKVKKTLLPATE